MPPRATQLANRHGRETANLELHTIGLRIHSRAGKRITILDLFMYGRRASSAHKERAARRRPCPAELASADQRSRVSQPMPRIVARLVVCPSARQEASAAAICCTILDLFMCGRRASSAHVERAARRRPSHSTELASADQRLRVSRPMFRIVARLVVCPSVSQEASSAALTHAHASGRRRANMSYAQSLVARFLTYLCVVAGPVQHTKSVRRAGVPPTRRS